MLFGAFLLGACQYGSEFAEEVHLKDFARTCGVDRFKITYEDNLYYLDIESEQESQNLKTCVEQEADKAGLAALVRIDEKGRVS
ncbi:hypothetical protein [Sphingopyxis sp.]|uniref:hypothetical protein n=1 Tax=Sphingopyxis sp. TaxID=1908224 RepID=UPI0035B0D175